MSQDFEALGFSWNHPSQLTWECCAKIHDLTPLSKRIVPKPDLHFLWATIVGKVVWFHKKRNLYPTNQPKKMEMTFYICPLLGVYYFPIQKKKRNGKILGNSWRHKVLHLGYVNVGIKVPHISRMWLWWVWKNRRPEMDGNQHVCLVGGRMNHGIVQWDPFVWGGNQSWCKCMVIWGIAVVIVHCLGWLYNEPWSGGMDD